MARRNLGPQRALATHPEIGAGRGEGVSPPPINGYLNLFTHSLPFAPCWAIQGLSLCFPSPVHLGQCLEKG